MPDKNSWMLAIGMLDVKVNFVFENFKEEVINTFIQIISQFYNCKPNQIYQSLF